MKKRYILIGALALSSGFVKAQGSDSLYKKEVLNKTDIEILYSHYSQTGDHSAITGGIGTERLTVYAPSISLNSTIKRKNLISFRGGADVITSASTDKIDFVVSSASYRDTRWYGNISYGRWFEKKDIIATIGTGLSIESDYTSVPLNFSIRHGSRNRMQTWSVDVQMFFDDLRWGRLNEDYLRPVKLIYPSELRYQEWYTKYRRNSYNFKFGFSQAINKRLLLGIYPEISYQSGLLATPYHRVYFTDGSEKVEYLPYLRWKGSLGIKANYFAGGRTIIKNFFSIYQDDFGILGVAFDNETAVKLSGQWTLSPFFRIYLQNGSKYFAPYMQHSPADKFYTSDYDLSTFNSYKAGLGLRYAPFLYMGKRSLFDEINLRYAFYYRSDGLMAHIVSCIINLSFENKK